ncbi:flagellar hook protein FlgE [Ameyamaea chiangmaiensis NBRC 103196]|uniref:Flagellar hook protein FlgE n=1 Tax=Ameyamaea chiangmaiensis TaxID=442969 RepID=A0A850PG04_9PROT|nr:flagellar hook-basal body complex protein [Ameyamaea chiangmaiensis]MBS4075039.1 flagellar hook-basal body complex protein [Ameyamaea chiangmaiensis]NVN40081.1 flagellar hook-basal body complex protein [Ameyamaea chiangmaiensis]GBQ65685.1 flagellar hook protein FlgE [Ameyamaea chiangmaiensis NBRC 103196]
MSIFNALTTAVSGINAQSHALSDLSNNIANSQTVGFKASDTSFEDYVTQQTGAVAASASGWSDSVSATTLQRNDVQGTITSSTNSLALAISGNGFFTVAQPSGASNATTTDFSAQHYYTRNGNFYENNQNYLVNTSGDYLEGYQVAANGTQSTALTPLQFSDVTFRPTVSLSGALGSTQATGGTGNSSTTVYDSSGNSHAINMAWSQDATNSTQWTLTVNEDGAASQVIPVQFNADGTLASVNGSTSTGTFNFANGTQNYAISLGTIGSASGASLATATQSSYSPTTSTDSVQSVNFEGLSMTTDGSVMATFDNGSSQLLAKIPLATFRNVNGLEAGDGQTYTATAASGQPTLGLVGENGTGKLATSSVESSTTDLTSDLSQLIVAQQAYTANTKVVTTSDSMLQATMSMVQ